MTRPARGFTLIELLAAMAILAVVSVMAVQALSGVFYQRSVLGRVDDRSAQLIRALSLLRQDMEAIVPWDEADETAEAGLVQEIDSVSFYRGGLARLPGVPGTGLARVTWAVDRGRLTRAVLRDPEAPPTEAETILDGVSALQIDALQAGPEPGAAIAPGYEIRLTTDVWGNLPLVVAP